MKSLGKEFVQYLVCELEMDPVEIASSSANELLDSVLAYEGYGMWAGEVLRKRVQQIYGIDLGEISTRKAKDEYLYM